MNAIPIHHNTFTKYTLVNYYYGRLGHNDKMDRLRYLYFISYRPKSISLYNSLKKTKLKSYKKLSNISFCTIYMAYFWRKVLSRNSYRTSFLGSVFAYITQQKLMLNKAISCCVSTKKYAGNIPDSCLCLILKLGLFRFLIGVFSKKTTLCLLNYVIKIVHFHELRDQDVDMHHALMRLYIF